MEGALEEVIIEALDQLDQGYTVEEILDRHPRHRADLRAILETAHALADFPPQPLEAAQLASRQRFLAEADRLRKISARPDQTLPTWRRFYYSLASLAVFLLLLGVVVVPPSGDAIPGDILYPVKRGAESVQLILAPEHEKQALLEEFEKERNHEVYEMLEIGRDGEAGYVGVLEAMGPDQWEIGHITALIDDATLITGDPEVGARIEAHCLIKDGQVIAESLTVLEPPSTIGPSQNN